MHTPHEDVMGHRHAIGEAQRDVGAREGTWMCHTGTRKGMWM